MQKNGWKEACEVIKGLILSHIFGKVFSRVYGRCQIYLEGDEVVRSKVIADNPKSFVNLINEEKKDRRKVVLYYKYSCTQREVLPFETFDEFLKSLESPNSYYFRWHIYDKDSVISIHDGEDDMPDIVVYRSGFVTYAKRKEGGKEI